MILFFNPRATRRGNQRYPLSILALAAMIEDRREQAEAAAESARNAAIVMLPANAWREIQQRAATVGISADLRAGGAELKIAVDLPSGEPA